MPSLEQLISNWRAAMRKNLDAESLEELEHHLRDAIADQIEAGKPPEEAFQNAEKQLGGGEAIQTEFNKVQIADWWAMKACFVFTILIVSLATILMVRVSGRPYGAWLGTHVAAVTIGFFATYMAGGLGIAFVAERCFAGFAAGRIQAAARAAITYSGVAAVFTAIGTILAMIWAKQAWGRYWAWDPKEVGAFGILVWQILFYLGGKSHLLPPRAVMTLAIFGNMVVSFGWFAPSMSYSLLIALLALHAPFLALAFAPSRCFNRQSEAGSR
jgi:hypothetical protein